MDLPLIFTAAHVPALVALATAVLSGDASASRMLCTAELLPGFSQAALAVLSDAGGVLTSAGTGASDVRALLATSLRRAALSPRARLGDASAAIALRTLLLSGALSGDIDPRVTRSLRAAVVARAASGRGEWPAEWPSIFNDIASDVSNAMIASRTVGSNTGSLTRTLARARASRGLALWDALLKNAVERKLSAAKRSLHTLAGNTLGIAVRAACDALEEIVKLLGGANTSASGDALESSDFDVAADTARLAGRVGIRLLLVGGSEAVESPAGIALTNTLIRSTFALVSYCKNGIIMRDSTMKLLWRTLRGTVVSFSISPHLAVINVTAFSELISWAMTLVLQPPESSFTPSLVTSTSASHSGTPLGHQTLEQKRAFLIKITTFATGILASSVDAGARAADGVTHENRAATEAENVLINLRRNILTALGGPQAVVNYLLRSALPLTASDLESWEMDPVTAEATEAAGISAPREGSPAELPLPRISAENLLIAVAQGDECGAVSCQATLNICGEAETNLISFLSAAAAQNIPGSPPLMLSKDDSQRARRIALDAEAAWHGSGLLAADAIARGVLIHERLAQSIEKIIIPVMSLINIETDQSRDLLPRLLGDTVLGLILRRFFWFASCARPVLPLYSNERNVLLSAALTVSSSNGKFSLLTRPAALSLAYALVIDTPRNDITHSVASDVYLIMSAAKTAQIAVFSGSSGIAAQAARVATVLISRASSSVLTVALSGLIPPLGSLWAEAARWSAGGGEAAEGARSLRDSLLELALGISRSPEARQALVAGAGGGLAMIIPLAVAALALPSDEDATRARGATLVSALIGASCPVNMASDTLRTAFAGATADAARAGSGAGARRVACVIATWAVWESAVPGGGGGYQSTWEAIGEFFALIMTHESARDSRAIAGALSVCISIVPSQFFGVFSQALGIATLGWALGRPVRVRREAAAATDAATLRTSVLLATAHAKRRLVDGAIDAGESRLLGGGGDLGGGGAQLRYTGSGSISSSSHSDLNGERFADAPAWRGEATRKGLAPSPVADYAASTAYLQILARAATRDARGLLRACQRAACTWPAAIISSGLITHSPLSLELAAEAGLGVSVTGRGGEDTEAGGSGAGAGGGGGGGSVGITVAASAAASSSARATSVLTSLGIQTETLSPMFGAVLVIAILDACLANVGVGGGAEGDEITPRSVWDAALYVIAASTLLPAVRSGMGEAGSTEPLRSLLSRASSSRSIPILLELYRFSITRNVDVLEPGAFRASLFAKRASEVATQLSKTDVPSASVASLFNGLVVLGTPEEESVVIASNYLCSEGLAVSSLGFSDDDNDDLEAAVNDSDDDNAGIENKGTIACFNEWRLFWSRNAEFSISMIDAARSTFAQLSSQLGPERFARVANSLPGGLRKDLLS